MRFSILVLTLVVSVSALAGSALAGRWFQVLLPKDGGLWLSRSGYYAYIPKNLPDNAPLVVYVHGCHQYVWHSTQTTRLNLWAEKEGFAVLYPDQSHLRNFEKCWNWFSPFELGRDGYEPASIVAYARQLQREFSLNPDETFLMGLSSGAGMSAILMSCYPEVFKAAAIHAGPPYNALGKLPGLDDVIAGASGLTDEQLALSSYHCQKNIPLKRRIPVLAMSGTRDVLVSTKNTDQMTAQFVLLNQLRFDGGFFGAQAASSVVVPPAKGKHGYKVWRYDLGEGYFSKKVIVQGLQHAWSGGPNELPFSDGKGPDATRMSLDFFSAQP